MKRSLDRTQERHLSLDYLLGYPMRSLVEWYGIPRASIYRTLIRLEVDTGRKAKATAGA